MKNVLLICYILIFTCLHAQTYKLEINLKNGSTATFLVDTISEIYFDNIDTKVLQDAGNAEIINSFVLFQNYPNPFNPFTTIKYFLHAPNLDKPEPKRFLKNKKDC